MNQQTPVFEARRHRQTVSVARAASVALRKALAKCRRVVPLPVQVSAGRRESARPAD
jgi:hypothetical protein